MKNRRHKAALRLDATVNIDSITHDITARLKRIINEQPVYKSCLNCDHFNEQTEGCAKANGARPPAKIIAYGCPAWEDDDDIPF